MYADIHCAMCKTITTSQISRGERMSRATCINDRMGASCDYSRVIPTGLISVSVEVR